MKRSDAEQVTTLHTTSDTVPAGGRSPRPGSPRGRNRRGMQRSDAEQVTPLHTTSDAVRASPARPQASSSATVPHPFMLGWIAQ